MFKDEEKWIFFLQSILKNISNEFVCLGATVLESRRTTPILCSLCDKDSQHPSNVQAKLFNYQ